MTVQGVLEDESLLTNINICEYQPEVHYRLESHLTNKLRFAPKPV